MRRASKKRVLKWIAATIVLLALAGAMRIYAMLCTKQAPIPATKVEFGKRYAKWQLAEGEWRRRHPFSSDSGTIGTATPLFEMGMAAVPFLIDQVEQDLRSPKWNSLERSEHLCILRLITGKRFSTAEFSAGMYGDQKEEMRLYVNWWRVDRPQTRAKFAALLKKWQLLHDKGNEIEAKETLDGIDSMGIDALPLAVDKIRKGDRRLVPLVNRIMRRNIGKTRPEILLWWKVIGGKPRLMSPSPFPQPMIWRISSWLRVP